MTQRLDIDSIKRSAPLTLIVERYLGAPVKRNGRGAWWRCPFHQEKTPSFLVGGRSEWEQTYHCFGCGRHGDVFEFVRTQEKLGDNPRDFVEVAKKVAALAGMPLPVGEGHAVAVPQVQVTPPPALWQEAAQAFVEQAQAALWQPQGAGCLRYLREKRGLTDETIRAWGLGWNQITRKNEQALWSMPDREKPVWLPQGLVIPGRVGDTLWYVKIRPSAEVRKYFEAKYYQLPMPEACERGALLGADRWVDGLPVFMAEGEMDLFTAWQQARDLVNPGTLGGAAKGRAGSRLNLGRWLLRLAAAPRILAGYDPDNAGREAESAFGRISERFEPVQVPWGADVNDYHVQGGDVAAWLRLALGIEPEIQYPEREEITITRDVAAGYPVTLIFQEGIGLAVGKTWTRLEDGRIEAVFESQEELETAIEATRAIGMYVGLRQ